MKQETIHRINGVKRFIRCFPEDTIWLFRHYAELKRELEKSGIENIKSYKFASWHSGFNYFTGTYKEDKVFIKVCAGEYDTIETEGKLKEYNVSDIFPEVIGYSTANIHYVITKFVRTKKMDASMSLEVKQSIAAQAGEILDRLLEYGIVHRDIRPENLMLTEANKLLLFDFGWALYRDWDYKRTKYTFVEEILNIQYRRDKSEFDDAVSMYLSLKEIFGEDSEELLSDIEKRIGRFAIKG